MVNENRRPEVEIVPNDPNKIVEVEQLESDINKLRVTISLPDKSLSKTYVATYSTSGSDLMQLAYDVRDVSNFEVSAQPEVDNVGENMFDQDLGTRWTAYDLEATATLELTQQCDISAVALGFWKGNSRVYEFDISVSTDGVNYTKVGSYHSSGEEEDYEIFRFPTVQAKYVRYTGHGNNENSNSNILEFRVLNAKEQ